MRAMTTVAALRRFARRLFLAQDDPAEPADCASCGAHVGRYQGLSSGSDRFCHGTCALNHQVDTAV